MLGFTIAELVALFFVALSIGMGKSGLPGINLPSVAVMAHIFGAKASTGVILPILMIGDIFGVYFYKKYVKLTEVFRLLLPAATGVILGAILGNSINDSQFKFIMSIVILICVAFLIHKEIKNNKNGTNIPSSSKVLYILIGVLSGFSSMIGNAAGPIFAVYLLAMQYKKNKYIAVTAVFFFAVNWIKLPFHVFLWNTINWQTLKIIPLVIPIIFLGSFLGVFIAKRINEKKYRIFIITMTVIAALQLMF